MQSLKAVMANSFAHSSKCLLAAAKCSSEQPNPSTKVGAEAGICSSLPEKTESQIASNYAERGMNDRLQRTKRTDSPSSAIRTLSRLLPKSTSQQQCSLHRARRVAFR